MHAHPLAHPAWLPCSYDVAVVHAGMLPGVPLEQQQLVHLSKMRDLLQAPDGRCVCTCSSCLPAPLLRDRADALRFARQ